jgi:hypothetical protein
MKGLADSLKGKGRLGGQLRHLRKKMLRELALDRALIGGSMLLPL